MYFLKKIKLNIFNYFLKLFQKFMTYKLENCFYFYFSYLSCETKFRF